MIWIDEILRSGFGFLASWPLLHLCQKTRLKSVTTGLLLSVYMVVAWRVYAWLAELVA